MGTKSRRAGLGIALAAAVAASLAPTLAVAQPDGGDRAGTDRRAAAASLKEQVAKGTPGAMVEIRDGRGSWFKAAGAADLTTKQKMQREDRFRIASSTKSFTAATVLALEAEGKLDLDDTVEQWLPGLVRGNGNDGSKVTIRHLLQNTSGIFPYTATEGFTGKYFQDPFLTHRFDHNEPEDLVRLALTKPPQFAPGARMEYNNTGWILAGMIIEKAAGRGYEQEVERLVIKPLKLRNTFFPGASTRIPAPAVSAYSKLFHQPHEGRPVHDVSEHNVSWGWAAGGAVSTTGDLQRFVRALIGGKLLPAAQQKALMTTVPGTGSMEGIRYGLGVYERTLSCGTKVWGHGGSMHGAITEMNTTRDAKRSVVAHYNGDWVSADGEDTADAAYCGTKRR